MLAPAVWGKQPLDGDGKVKVTLSEESSDVLAKVPDLKKWRVAPTMTRGSRAAYKDQIERAKAHMGTMQVKMQKKLKAKKDSVKKNQKAEKKAEKKKLKKQEKKEAKAKSKLADLSTEDLSAAHFRRTSAGRAAIKLLMTELHALDCKQFGQSPCFDGSGHCRLKMDGASTVTWDEIHATSPAVMESMRHAFHNSTSGTQNDPIFFVGFCS